MKPFRVVVLAAVTLALLAGAFFWSRRAVTKTAATPAECLDAYYESLRSGNVEQYRSCLDGTYRSQAGARSFDDARRDLKDVKNWVQLAGPVEGGSSVWVDVDEVRAANTRRVRYHLQQAGGGWVIVAVDPPREVPRSIPYGTRVGEEP